MRRGPEAELSASLARPVPSLPVPKKQGEKWDLSPSLLLNNIKSGFPPTKRKGIGADCTTASEVLGFRGAESTSLRLPSQRGVLPPAGDARVLAQSWKSNRVFFWLAGKIV